MAQPESAAEIARRLERDQINANRGREVELEQSLAGFKVGSVRFLNGVPLTRGLEDQVLFDVPSKLAQMLRRDELDAALVSITEVLFNDRYDILDNVAIASLGEVQSVLLVHRKSIDEMKEVFCDTASLTSVNLLRVLLAERGLKPEFKPLPNYDYPNLPDYTLLIGDSALDVFTGNFPYQIWDLGTAWYEMTKLPFVYAVWALQRGIENSELRRQLREAKAFGLDTLDHIIRNRTEYTEDFRRDYLGWHIHYHLGDDEKRGIAKFVELLRKHGNAPVYEPKFVS